MAQYVVGRLLQSVVTLFFIALITFALMHKVPGGPFDALAGQRILSQQFITSQESYYGFDKPLPEQFIHYLGNLVHGDLGLSFAQKGVSVSSLIAQKVRPSAVLGAMSFLIVFAVGIPVGVVTAIRRNTVWDYLGLAMSTVLAAVPGFVLAFFMLIVFAVWLGWFNVRMGTDFAQNLGTLKNGLLPAIALGATPMALVSRLTRGAMLEVLDQDYIRTARAKGLSRAGIYMRHAFRNALIPVVTLAGPIFAGLVTGSIIIEQIFGIAGIGSAFVTSVFQRDYGMIMGTTLLYASVLLVMNLLVDLVYPLVDPRVRL
jgi:oligopeptide transport system permease protein